MGHRLQSQHVARTQAPMVESRQSDTAKLMPSQFMRRLRPDCYSDTEIRTAYRLDKATLAHHLDTLTARNETHEFEIFCRKLCEQTICPNLLPATGPEGGGDSKADTETIPVADEIASLTYVGTPAAGRERWAFAFSAKKTWAAKVRSDVAGIVATGRGYQRIYCVTARTARAKDRSHLADELSQQYGVPVTILDQTWIVEQVVDHDRKHLAFNYFGVGDEVTDPHRLGPTDYSRAQQLEDAEKALADPEAFRGMEMQRATEALVAAKLSRNMERPRTETDGRFVRAVRLAESGGTYRQQLEANYEWIWTGYWWFDDIGMLNAAYDSFETLALKSTHAKNVEFLCNLAQLLFNSVTHRHLTAEEAKLDTRVARLSERLRAMSEETDRANHALEALTSLLLIEVSQAQLKGNAQALAALWPRFSDVLARARGLAEFSAERLVRLVEVCGHVAGSDSSYAQLVDDLAAFVCERTSEAEGALVLLRRAKQLGNNDHLESIRLLGKAARQLTKKEHADSLAEATRLLAFGYRTAGLPWAARASCVFSLATAFIEAEEVSEVPAAVVPTTILLAWIALELRHLPDVLEAVRLLRGCAAGLPLDDESQERLADQLVQLDLVLASQIVTLTTAELDRVQRLPDVLAGLGLYASRSTLLYALGYENVLREDGSIPADETPATVEEMFTTLLNRAAKRGDDLIIFNEPRAQIYVCSVLGMRVECHHGGSDASTLAAEALSGSIEALFATAPDVTAHPHTERFNITIEERTDLSAASFTIDRESMEARIQWPAGRFPAAYGLQGEVKQFIGELAGHIFATTCFAENMTAVLTRFVDDESVLDRIAMIVAAGNSRHRIFRSGLSRLEDWTRLGQTAFEPRASRPRLERRAPGVSSRSQKEPPTPAAPERGWLRPSDHRELAVRSVIDVHLWDRARWNGTAFGEFGADHPPILAFLFTERDAGQKIFERWRERFGQLDEDDQIYVAIVRSISADNPTHYRVMVTSRPPAQDEIADQRFCGITSRMQTMTPDSDVNLARFLEAYRRINAYVLMPACRTDNGEPEFITSHAILKRRLTVKDAAEVGEQDMEAWALGSERNRASSNSQGGK